jgi:heme-degrading monooxygenase HmoA
VLTERTEFVIKSGSEVAFGTAVTEHVLPLLQSVPGVASLSFGRGVENRRKFLLLVGWTNMAAHMAYRLTPASAELKRLIGHFIESVSLEHFELD